MKQKKWGVLCGCCLFVAGMVPSYVFAATLGQSCALTGPTAFLGQEMRKGAKAYFDARAAGDVVLLTQDDGYEPNRCFENTENFLQEGVDALFGYVGTPTSKVAVPLATENKKLFFGAFTGAGFLSDVAANPYSFSVRAGYDAEIENMMRHLKEDLGVKRVGLFVQRDAFGIVGVRAAVRATEKVEGIRIVPAIENLPDDESSMDDWNAFWKSVPNYRRNTVAVGRGVRQVRGQAVEAVILVGAARPCALAINQWHKIDFKVPMLNISFVGSTALASRLKTTENVYISQVVPDPWDETLPVVKRYQQDIGTEEYGFVSLEGYIAANIFHQAMGAITGEVTSDALKNSLELMSGYDLGGVDVSFGPDDHRGMDLVQLTRLEKSDGKIKFIYVDTLIGPE
jgi:ABC-type branched-subunit amino acid transport system substrate-binding protein